MGQLEVNFQPWQCHWGNILAALSQKKESASGRVYSWLRLGALLEQKVLTGKIRRYAVAGSQASQIFQANTRDPAEADSWLLHQALKRHT